MDPISLLSHAKLLPCNELREFGGKWKGMAIRVYYHAHKRHLLHLMTANTYMYSFNRKHFCSPTEGMHVNPLHSPASENITKAWQTGTCSQWAKVVELKFPWISWGTPIWQLSQSCEATVGEQCSQKHFCKHCRRLPGQERPCGPGQSCPPQPQQPPQTHYVNPATTGSFPNSIQQTRYVTEEE